WLPVICMPSPESPAKRITARSITSRLVFDVGGTSASVDISWLKPPLSLNSPPGSVARFRMRRCGERMASQANRREPTDKGYHSGSWKEERAWGRCLSLNLLAVVQVKCHRRSYKQPQSALLVTPQRKCEYHRPSNRKQNTSRNHSVIIKRHSVAGSLASQVGND